MVTSILSYSLILVDAQHLAQLSVVILYVILHAHAAATAVDDGFQQSADGNGHGTHVA